MATLTEQVQAALNPVTPGGCFYGVNTKELNELTVYPFLVFIKVVSTVNNTLAGPTDIQNTRIQVDLYNDTIAGIEQYGPLVVAAMAAAFPQSIQLSSDDAYESEVRVFRRVTHFSVWSTN